MPELSKEALREWLVAKEPDDSVGEPGNMEGCPGATWLYEVLDDCDQVGVTHGNGLIGIGDGAWMEIRGTEWLGKFARAIDLRFGIQCFRDVTAKQALEVLDSLDVS